MPGIINSAAGTVKRKRQASRNEPSKRSRSESSEEDVQGRILSLENEIFEAKKHYNNISTLIQILRGKGEPQESSYVAAIALCRVFARLMASGDFARKSDASEKDAIVIQWLKERYSEYKIALLELLASISGSTALTLAMRTLKNEGTYLRNDKEYNFPTSFLTDIIRLLLRADIDDTLRKEFSEKYVEEYDDVRFYTFEAVEKILGEVSQNKDDTVPFDNVLTILTTVESVPEEKEEIEDFFIPAPKRTTNALYSLTAHKKRAQGAWLAVLRLQMTKDQRKAILDLMATSIAPWFLKPELLMDFLTDSYDTGGSTSLQALSGVFYLIQERNLDYPSFYKKLYSLLDAGLLHSKHRSKFFRLLDMFLASSHLPAVLVASFIKRLSRLTLHAPPAGVVVVVPYLYNLLKKHPTCTFMTHRETVAAEAKQILESEGMDDPFLADLDDPMNTNAIDSSLWEIVMLQSHYHPNVATLAKIISEQFSKQAYNLEDFLDHSYGSMLDAELSKEVKKVPVVEFEIPKKILTKQDLGSGMKNGLLAELWTFN
ncbi:MAG: hypothetical protein M1818_000787 [Claussenomyces sp. TS43310]|nr:MAG: hypothetical protein M1818_000787 [Claussenomyces sp. TS43310]